MFGNSKKQNAGNNSTQVQAENVFLIQGIDEERVRAIIDEKLREALKEFSVEARNLAQDRIIQFADVLIPKLVKAQILESLSDPSIQILLLSAQRAAASTERSSDYGLLSELLIHRIRRKDNRNTRAGVSRAVGIVDEISDEALLGLTVAHAIGRFFPTSGDVHDGLNVLSSMFSKLLYGTLPSGETWLEQLEILNAVRISSIGNLTECRKMYAQNLAGYIDAGIEKDSENHKKAIEILNEADLAEDNLVDHALCNGYVRLNIANIRWLEESTTITEEQKKAFRNIYSMYTKNADLMQKNRNIFFEIWDEYNSLKEVRAWWNAISMPFNITLVGRILAHANAQRCDYSLPDLDR